MKYTIDDARREMIELREEDYSYWEIVYFLNDLKRGNDITKEEWSILCNELTEVFLKEKKV